MIQAITRLVSNPSIANFARDTNSAVFIETTLKAIGRPGFILIDKDIDNDTRKYAAAKEFLYQLTCLAVYFVVVVPIFRKGVFKFAKNHIYKDHPEFLRFKDIRQYMDYHKLAEKNPKNRPGSLSKDYYQDKFIPNLIPQHKDELLQELAKDEPKKYDTVKGTIEFGNIAGSVFGLAILAPQISHMFIHPALKFLGLEAKPEKKPEASKISGTAG